MRNTKKHLKKNSLGKALLIGGSASVLMSLFTPSLLAEEVNSALNANKKVADDVEVIQVSGIRSSLESALMEKREAPSIVDAISAKDMDALPALDLGEALQALPGIQLNTDDGQRNSEINLRGLSGGFVKTTAEGQGFATPSRSGGAVGGSNPFGSFEAGVFDGVTVVKSPTADLQEGGIAGVVNKKLQRALGSKDGKYTLKLGSRYEELADNWDNEFGFSASKHLIKDKLAVAFKIAGSEQNFRRDTANFTQYNSLNTVQDNAINYTSLISANDLEAYKAAHGINEPLSIIKVIGKAGQVTENSRGDRFSATGNIEWKPFDSLKVGVNLLYTRRELGESNMEDVQFSLNGDNRTSDNLSQLVELDADTAPIRLSDNPNNSYNPETDDPALATIPVYAVTNATLHNVSWAPSNRLQSFTEEAKGVFLYANYTTDDWKIDATISKSDSVNEFLQEGMDVRHSTKDWAKYTDVDSGQGGIYYLPTGLTGTINTGKGDLKQAKVTLEGMEDYVYSAAEAQEKFGYVLPALEGAVLENGDPGKNNVWERTESGWKTVRLSSFGSLLDPKLNQQAPEGWVNPDPEGRTVGGKSVEFYVNGRVQRPERDYESGNIDFERFTDIGGDAFRLTSVKFGAFHSQEVLESYDLRVGGGAMNVSGLNRETLFKEELTSEGQAEYFNGDFPGYYNGQNGWTVLDSKNLKPMIQENMQAYAFDTEGNALSEWDVADPTGFAVRLQGDRNQLEYGLNEYYRNNFSADQIINAVYLMGNFEGELGNMPYRGNLGVRYIETTNDVLGQGFNKDGRNIDVLTETDYNNTLPSFNFSLDLTDDLVLRTAYSEGLVRPNLLAQTPSPAYTNSDSRVRWENSKAEVLPYTADSYDLSLAWYNREGSALSVGVFRKEIQGKIVSDTICPTAEGTDWDLYGVSPEGLEEIDVGKTIPECREKGEYDPGDGGDVVSNRLVVIKQTYNSDIPITVTGYELAVQQKLDFLPYPFDGLGGTFNFTKIDLDEGDGQPMTRIAPYSYNIVTYYENDGIGLRLAYNWQDEKLLSAGGNTSFLGSDARTQTAGGRLDLSATYRFKKSLRGLVLSAKAFNLNNRQEYEYIGGNDEALSRIRYAGRTYQVGLSYSF